MPVIACGFVQGITHSFSRFGNAVTPSLVALLVLLHSWRFSFIALGAITAVWLAFRIAGFRDNPHQIANMSEEERKTLPQLDAGVTDKVKTPTPWKALLKRIGPTMGVYFCWREFIECLHGEPARLCSISEKPSADCSRASAGGMSVAH